MMTVQPEMIDVVETGFTVLDRLYAEGDFSGEALGGSCGNVLVSLALLRRQVAPVLSLGSDEVGEQLVDAFRIAGADTRFIWHSEGRRSPVQIGRAHVELQSLMRISYAVFCLKKKKSNRE